MAEIGIIASVIQVAGAGLKLSQTLYQYADSVSGAESRVKNIAKEVQLTSFVIEELGHIFKQDQSSTLLSKNAIKTADETLRECSSVFTELDVALKKTKKNALGRFIFPFRETKMELLRSHIDKLKNTLQLLMQVLTHAHMVASQKLDREAEAAQREHIKTLLQNKKESTKRYEESLRNYNSDDEVDKGIDDEDSTISLRLSASSIVSSITTDTLATCVQHVKSLLTDIESLQQALSEDCEDKDPSEHTQSLVGSYFRARHHLDTVLLGNPKDRVDSVVGSMKSVIHHTLEGTSLRAVASHKPSMAISQDVISKENDDLTALSGADLEKLISKATAALAMKTASQYPPVAKSAPANGKRTKPAQRARSPVRDALSSRVLDIIAAEIEVDLSELIDTQIFEDMGVESLMAYTISARLREDLNLEISPTLFTDFPTVGEMKKFFAQYDSTAPTADTEQAEREEQDIITQRIRQEAERKRIMDDSRAKAMETENPRPATKNILRKPIERSLGDPEPIREGVAPVKGIEKDIAEGIRSPGRTPSAERYANFSTAKRITQLERELEEAEKELESKRKSTDPESNRGSGSPIPVHIHENSARSVRKKARNKNLGLEEARLRRDVMESKSQDGSKKVESAYSMGLSPAQSRHSLAPENTPSNPQVEIFKSFRISIDDPCHKVLPVALRKQDIQDDWRNYDLYIVYGDSERRLGLSERPMLVFKELDRDGKRPMFKLKKHPAPAEGTQHFSAAEKQDVQQVSGSDGLFVLDETPKFSIHSRQRPASREKKLKALAAVNGLSTLLPYAADLQSHDPNTGNDERQNRSRRSSVPNLYERARSRSRQRDPKTQVRLDNAAIGGLMAFRLSKSRNRSRSQSRKWSRSRSRERSHSRVRAGHPITTAGLAGAAGAGLYERNKAKKEAREQSRPRSRSRSPHPPDRTPDDLVKYHADPGSTDNDYLYRRSSHSADATEHQRPRSSSSTTKERSSSRLEAEMSRSHSDDQIEYSDPEECETAPLDSESKEPQPLPISNSTGSSKPSAKDEDEDIWDGLTGAKSRTEKDDRDRFLKRVTSDDTKVWKERERVDQKGAQEGTERPDTKDTASNRHKPKREQKILPSRSPSYATGSNKLVKYNSSPSSQETSKYTPLPTSLSPQTADSTIASVSQMSRASAPFPRPPAAFRPDRLRLEKECREAEEERRRSHPAFKQDRLQAEKARREKEEGRLREEEERAKKDWGHKQNEKQHKKPAKQQKQTEETRDMTMEDIYKAQQQTKQGLQRAPAPHFMETAILNGAIADVHSPAKAPSAPDIYAEEHWDKWDDEVDELLREWTTLVHKSRLNVKGQFWEY